MDSAALDRVGASTQGDINSGRILGASILIARGGQIVYRRSLGTVAADRPATDDDKYLLMSMSKSFTAALILRAVDQGRFGLDTRVDDLVPGFGTAGKGRATLRHLMTHTAGLPFGMVPPGVTPAQIGDLPRKAAAIAAIPAAFAPGARCVYTSGLGYDLLGHILVNTDPKGRNFRKIMHDDLFVPLGMTDSSFGLPLDDPRRVPVSFTEQNTGPTTPAMLGMFNQAFDADAEVPSGNAYSTIDDVFRFTEALRSRGTANGYRLMSPALFDYARQNHTGELPNEAFNFEVQARNLDPLIANFTLLGGYVRGTGHSLTSAGYTASPETITAVGGASTGWMIDPQHDLTVIYLSAGFIEGLRHFERLQRINDLALAAVS
ncbi:serine hydrolase domain-containing protein [Actinoplanes sp. NBRC 101535]|uniref:serine hydrolase domain-containing protein n=1 Tax=Actinoplanes sp. NBRC 101535 TaxID=3032196 RepID=UPI0025578D6A|nr:serine hydrolase domain-containing protein [Actinoplanes sp. NBRC 101535]